MKIQKMSYEECREDFFVNLIKHAENKIKYWKRQKCYRCEIDYNLAEAGAEMNYCQDALKALEKQIPKKSTPYKGFEGKCTCCGVIFLDRSTNYCGNCGQALDWSTSDETFT